MKIKFTEEELQLKVIDFIRIIINDKNAETEILSNTIIAKKGILHYMDLDLIDEGIIDSLSVVDLVMNIEEHFEIEISDDEVEIATTLQHYVDMIKTKLE